MAGGTGDAAPLSATDFHVLLALREGASYGYAVMKAVEDESGGSLTPEIGSLYRVLGRLMGDGLVEECPPPEEPGPHPGRPRKYYRLTRDGVGALRSEVGRLRDVLDLARARDLVPGDGS